MYRHLAGEELHGVPRQRRTPRPEAEEAQDACQPKTPKDGARSGIHARQPADAPLRVQQHIVHAHHTAARDIDHLVIEQIAGQEHLTRAAREGAQIDTGGSELNALGVHALHLLPGHEVVAIARS